MAEATAEDALRAGVLKLEKGLLENVQMRQKYSGDPQQFLQSELDLAEDIAEVQALMQDAGVQAVLRLELVPTVVELLGHENVDVNALAVSFVHAMVTAEGEEVVSKVALVEALTKHKVVQCMVSLYPRLIESGREDTLSLSLIVFENGIDYVPRLASCLVTETDCMDLLISIIENQDSDTLHLHAAELLGILVQTAQETGSEMFARVHGVERCVRLLHQHISIQTEDFDLIEEVHYIGNAIVAALLFPPARGIDSPDAVFKQCVEMMRSGTFVRISSIRIIELLLVQNTANCTAFVNSSGLKGVFTAFMGKMKSLIQKFGESCLDLDEKILLTLNHLFMNLSDTPYLRLLKKFSDHSFEKVDRLFELRDTFSESVAAVAETSPEESYAKRIDAGLFNLQLVDTLIAFLATCGNKDMEARIDQTLHQHNITKASLRATLSEYVEALDTTSEAGKHTKTTIQSLINLIVE